MRLTALLLGLLLVGAAASWTAPAAAGDRPRATVVVDGEEREVRVTPLEGDGSAPRADDLLDVGPGIFRGEGTSLRLRSDGGRWYELDGEGRERLVALRISDGSSMSDELLSPEDALALPESTCASLRGLRFHGWRNDFAALVARVDAGRCLLRIHLASRPALPPLPPGFRAIEIDDSGSGPLDVESLRNQTQLVRLVVGSRRVSDWTPLAGLTALRSLEALVAADSVPTVPELPSLVEYDSGYDGDDVVTDLSFVARFPALEDLWVSTTAVTDLSPIEGLARIRGVRATLTGLTRLPAGRVPSLRSLRILGHRVPREELEAFVAANPQCDTTHSFRQVLDAAAVGVDRLRLRTGGLCHRSPKEEDVLFETADADEVRRFLDLLVVDDPSSSGRCMCCGEPTVELLRGGEIVESISVHHGAALRWHGWPVDGRLVPDAADAISTWLTSHGASTESPRQQRTREQSEEERDAAAQDALLGEETGAEARACRTQAEFDALVNRLRPEADGRIVLLDRLASLGAGPRDGPVEGLADRAWDLLRREDPVLLAAVLAKVLSDEATPSARRLSAARTVARLDGDESPFPADARSGLRFAGARALIALGGREDHDRAVRMLERVGTPDAAALAFTLLPPFGEDGKPLAVPTRDQLYLLENIVLFCPDADVVRLRALVAASRDPEGWGEWFDDQVRRRERVLERRRKAKSGPADDGE